MSYRAPAFADFQPALAAPGCTPERLAYLEEHSFVIIDDFADSPWIPILREAGRRVTMACAPENGYEVIDSSRGYVHRAAEQEPWAIRGLAHPAFLQHNKAFDARRVTWENALHTVSPLRNLANREGRFVVVDSAVHTNNHAFVSLNALLVAFGDAVVHPHGATHPEVGQGIFAEL